MSAKVDSADVAIPEASPDSNEKQPNSPARSSRRHLWIGGISLLAVIATVAIAVPLAMRNDGGGSPKAVTTQSAATNSVHQCIEPKEGDPCTTQESYEECLSLVNNGCWRIYSTFSCPPLHRCGDTPAEQLPELPPVACTLELKPCPDGSSVGRTGPNCEFEACPGEIPEQLPEHPVACTMELKPCPDGSSVGRTGPNCEFEACPGENPEQLPEHPVACTMELKPCPDGSSVGRTGPNCEFEACPGVTPDAAHQCIEPKEGDPCTNTQESYEECLSLANNGCKLIYSTFSCPPMHRCGDEPAQQLSEIPPVACTLELKPCPDGSSVGRTGPNCEFEACPGETPEQLPEQDTRSEPEELPLIGCTMELAWCPDGTSVGRSGPNCEFEPCPDGACPVGTYLCDDGTELERDAALGCEFPACPAPVACPMDAKACADGSYVGRIGPDCEFQMCPEEMNLKCTREVAYCADGTPVGRAPPACTLEACPDGSCPTDLFTCPGGLELRRDPNLYCEFPACP